MNDKKILLGHGSGGEMSNALIADLFRKYFSNPILNAATDSAVLRLEDTSISYTTDSYVVDPIFFPGGNIGKLAICGTVNDLAVSGALPKYISCGFIIEEGFSFNELEEIVNSMASEALKAGVTIVTGDTKVVNRGKCDKIFINTSGIGILDEKNRNISYGSNIKPGDKVIVNGTIGDHGIAIIGTRNELGFSSDIKSDCACLNGLIASVLASFDGVRFMRDATRGGLASVLCEIAEKSNAGITLNENLIPIRESVRGMCEVFGFDPLHVANEGKIVMIAAKEEADKIIRTMNSHEYGKDAAIIGEITESSAGKVILKTSVGGNRIVDMLAGEQLPRIC